MPNPDEAVVRRVLAQNERDVRIRFCIEKAWEDLKLKYTDMAWWRRKSTTRAIMWENSVQSVLAELSGDNGIRSVPHDDTISFIADDLVRFRLKKAALSLFTSNFPTPLAGLFHTHEADLFGHAGHHRVEIVHVFNRFQTALDWIGVVGREKKEILWKFELPRGGASIEALPPVVPTKPASDSVLSPAAKTGQDTKTNEDKK
ncbi:hypothetical protein ASD50_05975 [Mesorhizobium sp. Root552]|uniref:hypothetical protein n=1 Tax=Mesorhizobium sp. Root552 TaxID=1736555 RepID=UPI0006F1D243|nr:hypothetical protein [Mesorhizobium sp. Root552]KQZ19059.1 hypothetical protein ASD50_05975 [Mesorhizobium sp. Root552]